MLVSSADMERISKFTIIVFLIALGIASCQESIGDKCTFNGSLGECKIFSDCSFALQNLLKHNRTPQTCAFQGKEPVVCCPQQEERTPGDRSRQKCREYSSYVYTTQRAPILIIGPVVKVFDCGYSTTPLIVGSTQPSRKEFPHMAAIGFEATSSEVQWQCGGTLISENYVLTAAHCLTDSAKWVKLGVTRLGDTDHQQEIKIAEKIRHPLFKSSSVYHDIGLIKLEEPVKLSGYAKPACLYTSPGVNASMAMVTAWDGENGDLSKIVVDLVGHDSCNSAYKNKISGKFSGGILDDTQLCAGSLNKNKDLCQGDSGGALQLYHNTEEEKCMYDIIGITSFGTACSGTPEVYTRISHYIKWIEDIVWPA